MNIADNYSESLETVCGLKIPKFFDADPGSGIFLTLDSGSGMEKFGSGIRDRHPRFATLTYRRLYAKISTS
jgi:hypothetical protein